MPKYHFHPLIDIHTFAVYEKSVIAIQNQSWAALYTFKSRIIGCHDISVQSYETFSMMRQQKKKRKLTFGTICSVF